MGVFSFAGVRIVEAPKEAIPECPKCDARLDTIWMKAKGTGMVEQKQIIMCPHCKVFLGYGTFSL